MVKEQMVNGSGANADPEARKKIVELTNRLNADYMTAEATREYVNQQLGVIENGSY